jgi:chromosome segregation ATPase
MPEWLAIFLALLGGGLLTGAGAFIRARGQNRIESARQQTDDRALLFKDTREWLAWQDAQITNLIASRETLEKRLNEQAVTQATHSAAHSSEIAELQRQNRDQSDQMKQLRDQNTTQAQQIETQAQQIDLFTTERQQYIEQLAAAQEKIATVQARATWLESELNIEREEARRLKALMPVRIEVTE